MPALIKKTVKLLELQIIRFVCTGIIATLTHIFAAFTCIALANASSLIANFIGFCSAFCLSYYLQSRFVFRQRRNRRNLTRFFIVQSSALIVAQIITHPFASMNPYFNVLIVVLFIPLITFLIHRIWTYTNPIK